MRKTRKLLIMLFMCGCLALGVCGCGNGGKGKDKTETKTSAESDNGGKKGGNIKKDNSGHEDKDVKKPEKETGDNVLESIRSLVEADDKIAAMAYLGWLDRDNYDGTLGNTIKKLPLVNYLPFISEIPIASVLGSGCGDMICLIPLEGTSVSVNLIEWEPTTEDIEPYGVLYRSDSGEPIIIFCNEERCFNQTNIQVKMVSPDGRECTWYPVFIADTITALPKDEYGQYFIEDITDRSEEEFEYAQWVGDGWHYPEKDELDNTVLSCKLYYWDDTEYSEELHFTSPGTQKRGTVEYKYVSDGYEMTFYSGYWEMADKNGVNCLSMEMYITEGGMEMLGDNAPDNIHGVYPIIISDDGEMAIIGYAGREGLLPVQTNSPYDTTFFKYNS